MDEEHHTAVKELDKALRTAAEHARKDTAFQSTSILTLKHLRRYITNLEETRTGITSVLDAKQKELEDLKNRQKTGSVPRPPGTPLDGPAPSRVQDIVGQLSFFEGRPEVLRQATDEDIQRFLRAQIDRLQQEFSQEKPLPESWSRVRDLRQVSEQLTWLATHAATLRQTPPESAARVLAAWGQAIIPFLDDGEQHCQDFFNKNGEWINARGVLSRIRDASRAANEVPGRAWRLLAEVTDEYQRWTEKYLEEDPTESETEALEKIKKRKSARQLREASKAFYEEDLPRAASPFPEFHGRWPTSPSGRKLPPLDNPDVAEGWLVPTRPEAPKPGQLAGEQQHPGLPRLITTAPTWPTLPQQEGHYETPSATPEPEGSEIVVRQAPLGPTGKRRVRTDDDEDPIRPKTPGERSPPTAFHKAELKPAEEVFEQIKEFKETQVAASKAGFDPATHPESLERFSEIGFTYPSDDPDVIRKELLEKRRRRDERDRLEREERARQ